MCGRACGIRRPVPWTAARTLACARASRRTHGHGEPTPRAPPPLCGCAWSPADCAHPTRTVQRPITAFRAAAAPSTHLACLDSFARRTACTHWLHRHSNRETPVRHHGDARPHPVPACAASGTSHHPPIKCAGGATAIPPVRGIVRTLPALAPALPALPACPDRAVVASAARPAAMPHPGPGRGTAVHQLQPPCR